MYSTIVLLLSHRNGNSLYPFHFAKHTIDYFKCGFLAFKELSLCLIYLDFANRLNRSVFRSHWFISMVMIFLFKIMNSGAERFNGLMAMLGIVAGVGAYAITGQFIPGIF